MTLQRGKPGLVQVQMFILHKNLTKWAAGCTKTFGEGGGKWLLKKATRTVVTVTAGAKRGDSGGWMRPQHTPLHTGMHTSCPSAGVSGVGPHSDSRWTGRGEQPLPTAEYCV